MRNIFRKKESYDTGDAVPSPEEIPEEEFDANADGYYDDVIPELAEQINRLPTENVLRIVFTAVFAAAVIILALTGL